MMLMKRWERVIQEPSRRNRQALPLEEPRALGDFSTPFSHFRDTDNSPKNISILLRAFPAKPRRRLVTGQGPRPVLQGVCQRAERDQKLLLS